MYIEKEDLMTSKNSVASVARSLGRVTGVTLKWLLIVLVGVAVPAFLTESYFKAEAASHYPPPGQLYQVGEHKMHIWCEGSGEPNEIAVELA